MAAPGYSGDRESDSAIEHDCPRLLARKSLRHGMGIRSGHERPISAPRPGPSIAFGRGFVRADQYSRKGRHGLAGLAMLRDLCTILVLLTTAAFAQTTAPQPQRQR